MKDHGTTYGIISEGRLPNFAETAAKGDDKKKMYHQVHFSGHYNSDL